MKIIHSKRLKGTSIRAITLWLWVLVRDEKDLKNKVLLNHEKIHTRQWSELLVIPFLLWYLIEYGVRILKYRGDTFKAYMNISFEREAFANENNLKYLDGRKKFNWFKYINNK